MNGRAFLVGYYGVHNTGDEAIRRAIEHGAAARGWEIDRYATRDRSDRDPRAVPMRLGAAMRIVAAVRRADVVVLGGGGILKDEGLRLPLELFAITLAARILRRRVALLSVGVGPLYGAAGTSLVRTVARLAHVRTVRDTASAEVLSSLGVRRVSVAADPVFALGAEIATAEASRSSTAAPSAADEQDRAGGAARLVVSVRPWFLKGPDGAGRADRLRGEISGAIDRWVREGGSVRFINLYWPRDGDETEQLTRDATFPFTGTTDELDWPDLGREISTASLVLAMRYHAIACAALCGRPVIALAYEPKVASLAAELGIPSISVDDPNVGDRVRQTMDEVGAGRLDAVPSPRAVTTLREGARRGLDAVFPAGPGGDQPRR